VSPRPPRVGSVAPEFTATDQHGQTITRTSLHGSKAVLVFYPFAFSGVCTSELGTIRDSLDELRAEDAVVLAISCDPMYALRVFADTEKLAFPLLSDFWPHGQIADDYGVFDSQRGCALRGTFVLDADGVIRWSVVNNLPDARSIEDYQRALAELR